MIRMPMLACLAVAALAITGCGSSSKDALIDPSSSPVDQTIATVREAWRAADAAWRAAAGLQKLRLNDLRADYGRLIAVLETDPDFLGDLAADHTKRQLRRTRDSIVAKLNIPPAEADKMMFDLFGDAHMEGP